MQGIGVDMATVSRFKHSLENPKFANFVYSEREQDLFLKRERPKYNSLAANFRAKEAFSKALGTGVRNFSLKEVEILRDELGKPYFNFYGRAADIMLKNGYVRQVSLSHEGDSAIAFVLLEKTENKIKNL